MNRAKLSIEQATVKDIDELLKLYFSIYANTYPLKLGFDRRAMEAALKDPERFFWPLVRDKETGRIAGTVIFEMDLENKIGKISGLVVHQDYRGLGISEDLIRQGKKQILEEWSGINSLYATTRTTTLAPQQIFLKNGFLPLGIFPNAHKLKQYETLTLFAAFRQGILEKRAPLPALPQPILPIVTVMNDNLGLPRPFSKMPDLSRPLPYQVPALSQAEDEEEFEFIYAPQFVAKRFKELFSNQKGFGFYPFHTPNLLITSSSGEEIYACFNQRDHYCVIIATGKEPFEMEINFKNLIHFMKDHGISYIEVLLRLDHDPIIDFYSRNEFLPSAIYPAMREIEGKLHDYILFTRTMEPLDFKGINLARPFRPFVDQYIDQWFNMHIKTLEVDNGNGNG